MEFDRFSIFIGNERASGMEIVDFGIGSETFLMKRFARNGAFRGVERQWAEWVMKMVLMLCRRG